MIKFVWTDERVAEMRGYILAGKKRREIAALMGTTLDAVNNAALRYARDAERPKKPKRKYQYPRKVNPEDAPPAVRAFASLTRHEQVWVRGLLNERIS